MDIWIKHDLSHARIKKTESWNYEQDCVNGMLTPGDTLYGVQLITYAYDSFGKSKEPSKTWLYLTGDPTDLLDLIDEIDEYLSSYSEDELNQSQFEYINLETKKFKFRDSDRYIGDFKGWGTSYDSVNIKIIPVL
jgi:hypothetical protein